MAIMQPQTRMAFWKFFIDYKEVTNIIGPYINDLTIRNSIGPAGGTSGHDGAPITASISMLSKDYIEDWFVPGRKIEIRMGYDRIDPPLVFRGMISELPEGNAKDMLSYTVEMIGEDILLSFAKQIRNLPPYKTAAVQEILLGYDFPFIIDIRDQNIVPVKYALRQNNETDKEVLDRFAKLWNCTHWYDQTGDCYYFVDSDKAHFYTLQPTYVLGYRTDRTKCNVEVVEWKCSPPRAAADDNAGISGFNEAGKAKGIEEWNVRAPDDKGQEQTWQLKPEIWKKAQENPLLFRSLFNDAKTRWRDYESLRQYYVVVQYTENARRPPSFDDSGIAITINLNVGDPTLYPPRNCVLYAGSINPRADSSRLPQWLYRHCKTLDGGLTLKMNEVEHSFKGGYIKTQLKCSVGMFI